MNDKQLSVKFLSLAAMLFLTGLSLKLNAQKRDDLHQKYGAPDEKGRYRVRPNIGVKVETSADGRPSRAIMQRLDVDDPPRWDNPKLLLAEEAEAILTEVVPVTERGRLIGVGDFALGCTEFHPWQYERVTISFDTRCKAQGGGVYQATVHWKYDP